MKLLIGLWAAVALAQETPVLEAARAVMKSAVYCFLTTLDEAGQPQARLMQPFAPEPDMTVWLGTNPASRKAEQIRKDSRATLAYYDPQGPNYVTLIGKARLVSDLAERRRRWRADWDRHFPGGPEGANYVLIEFTPSRIELVSSTHKVAAEPATARPAILDRRGSGWALRAETEPAVSQSVESVIRRRRQAFVDAVNNKQWDALSGLLGAELATVTESENAAMSAAMFRDIVKRLASSGGTTLRLSMETLRVQQAGSVAYELGRFTRVFRQADGSERKDQGRYLDAWKQEADGEWRIVLHTPLFDPER